MHARTNKYVNLYAKMLHGDAFCTILSIIVIIVFIITIIAIIASLLSL